MGQNRIRGGWGVKNRRKSSDIIYVRSLKSITYLIESGLEIVNRLNLGLPDRFSLALNAL